MTLRQKISWALMSVAAVALVFDVAISVLTGSWIGSLVGLAAVGMGFASLRFAK